MAVSAWRPGQWEWGVPDSFGEVELLAREMHVDPLIAKMLHNRGMTQVDEGKAFLQPKLADLHDPALLLNCEAAADRLARAVADGEKILIYGDYDVDGITSISIMHSLLTMVGGDVSYYVPHRLDEGYGIHADAIDQFIRDGVNVMVTVDCGVTALDELAKATSAGIDVIVTDHHGLAEGLPDVFAVVHPNLPGQDYPCKNLAGAGVAFKLAWQTARAICGETRVSDELREFLVDATSLAALGTIADMVPLVGENRILAANGLRGLAASNHVGMKALLESAGLTGEKLSSRDVGFVLAPRLNACGRMGHADKAVEMFTGASAARCAELAAYLAETNTERQKISRAIADEAIEMVIARGLDSPENRGIVLGSDQWHAGVIGIVASRLVGMFCKPAVLVALDGGVGFGSGSARSVPGFHMRDALAATAKHLESFGGHAMAGGLRMVASEFDSFAAAFNRYANENVSDEQITPKLLVDAETTIGALGLGTVMTLEKMAPFGQGNPVPSVVVRGCEIVLPPKRIGRNGQTASMMLKQGASTMRAFGFQMGDLADLLVGVKHIDIAAQPVLNTYNGRTNVEVKLLDVKW